MPYISEQTINKIDDLPLVETIGNYVELKKQGANFVGLSPFTNEKTPSFNINPAKGIWKCFSTGKGGISTISFVMEYESLSFPEAIEKIANENAVSVEYDNSEKAKKYQEAQLEKESLYQILQTVIDKFQEEFKKLADDHPAKQEIYQHRQYNEDVVKRYGIGYAPGNKFIYDFCCKHNIKNNAIELGLITEQYDKWCNRVIYPLYEIKGGSSIEIGIAGRRISDNNKYPKWMNSNTNKLFNKDNYWYGLDSARKDIAQLNEVWIVEGYNDVIAFQENGIKNTIASCGTNISSKQIQKLKEYCSRVILCLDDDEPGKKATLKIIPEFFKHNFRVFVISLGDLDPDEFVRFWKPTTYDMNDLQNNVEYRDDGFKHYIKNTLTGNHVDDGIEARKILTFISEIDDQAMKDIYIGMLQKESKVKLSTLKAWIKNDKSVKKTNEKETKTTDIEYQLPKDVNKSLEELLPNIKKYQLFMANNKIYCLSNKKEPPYFFECVSNFDIEIIQHMSDEEYPSKLVKIKNINNQSAVFDMPSKDMNKVDSFETAITNHGNYRWKGTKQQHDLLKTYLFDNMGTGRRIDVLGWQPEGFWVWNNLVIDGEGNPIDIDKNGCFTHKGISYYIPSANSVYEYNRFFYDPQKRFKSITSTVTFIKFCEELTKVHRDHGIIGVLFSIASIFQDVVVKEIKGFPLLFLYGPASSGKDQLVNACQSFFGYPQSAINLEGDVSTAKANIREFAQFSNGIGQLSEYKPGNPKLDGILKGLWDRNGYKRGNLQSRVSTESIPILSSVIMTGNFEPNQDALITRCIYVNMNKTSFTPEEEEKFKKFNEIVKVGISGYTNDFLKYRNLVENNFMNQYTNFKREFSELIDKETNSRMITNLSILGSFYLIFKDLIGFSFTQDEMKQHFIKIIDLQMTKLKSASIITRFFDCFLASMRGISSDQIIVNRDFNVNDNKLYFQWTHCYNKISRQWSYQYKGEVVPSKNVMAEALKKDKCWIKIKDSHRFASGEGNKTSAYVIDLDKVSIKDEIFYAIEFQCQDNNIPHIPSDSNIDNEGEKDDNIIDSSSF